MVLANTMSLVVHRAKYFWDLQTKKYFQSSTVNVLVNPVRV
jgi:hypothetical protein